MCISDTYFRHGVELVTSASLCIHVKILVLSPESSASIGSLIG